MYVLDATKCRIEYDVPQCTLPSSLDCHHIINRTYVAHKDLNVVFAVGHQHVGGEVISLLVNGNTLCDSTPYYGVGSESGFLVKISSCTFQKPFLVKKGDRVTVVSKYNNQIYHDGVMALFLVGATCPDCNNPQSIPLTFVPN
jgi:hypothetical protein